MVSPSCDSPLISNTESEKLAVGTAQRQSSPDTLAVMSGRSIFAFSQDIRLSNINIEKAHCRSMFLFGMVQLFELRKKQFYRNKKMKIIMI